MDFDVQLRAHVYDATFRDGTPPRIDAAASALGVSVGEVRESLRRLAAARALVLQADDEILMANPFSAVPTPFTVVAGGRSYYGNCIWDALGIPALLGADATVTAGCGDCGEDLTLVVANGGLVQSEGVVHFAVPARRWWDNIGFT